MQNPVKEARRDAKEYARAQMFYGEGAGTRRKLIAATVDGKAHQNPTYGRLFKEELSRQDMAEHAAKARRERLRVDHHMMISRNAKGLATGNARSMNTSVLVVVMVGYVAHQTGFDAKVYEKGKQVVQDVRNRIHDRRAAKTVYHNVTTMPGAQGPKAT